MSTITVDIDAAVVALQEVTDSVEDVLERATFDLQGDEDKWESDTWPPLVRYRLAMFKLAALFGLRLERRE